VHPENASAQGVQAEAVVNDAHTLYLIVEADRRDRVEGLMAPFAQAGTVEVPPASSCDAMIGRRAAQHGGAIVKRARTRRLLQRPQGNARASLAAAGPGSGLANSRGRRAQRSCALGGDLRWESAYRAGRTGQ
jgi:hypothetical protein